jgi:ABC-type transport system involved in multi-copper enzyme maturation permease subunit
VSLAWRLHGRAVITSLVLVGCAMVPLVVAAITLPGIAHSFGSRPWIQAAPENYSPRYPDLALQALWMLIAAFVGVPLVGRDVAQGTARFAWTQGDSRGRWLLRTLLPVAGALTLAAVAFGLVFGWFFAVYPPSIRNWSAFGLFAPALAGWTLAGLTIGMLAGVVLRRGNRALAAALLAYWALEILVSRDLRPRYLPPVPGNELTGPARVRSLLVSLGTRRTWSFQPDDRFWTFQFIELGLLLGVAAICTGLTYWLISGRGLTVRSPRWSLLASWGGPSRSLAVTLGLLAAAALMLVITGPGLHAAVRHQPHLGDLSLTGPPFGQVYLVLALPLLLGAFLGGPLVARDIAQGTAAFAWTQGVTRRRWVTGQLLRLGVPLTLGALAVGLIMLWWAAPYTDFRLGSALFDAYPPVYAGWTLATFTLGALLGTALSEPVSAIVLTLVILLTVVLLTIPDGGYSLIQASPPTGRFWLLQAVVGAVLLALSGLLAAATVGLVQRRSA